MPFCFLFLEDGPSYTQRHLTAIPESTGISSFFYLSIFSFINHSLCYKIILLSVLFTVPCSAMSSETDFRSGVVSLISARSHTFVKIFVKIDPEIFFTGCSQLSFTSQKKVHKVLVNRLVKLAQEKVWLG